MEHCKSHDQSVVETMTAQPLRSHSKMLHIAMTNRGGFIGEGRGLTLLQMVGWLVKFYDISTLIDYLMLNPVYTYDL